MSQTPISVQLYSVRDRVAEVGMPAVLAEIAAIGYAAVEPAGFGEDDAAGFRQRVEDLGMRVSASHRPWCRPDTVNEAIEVAAALGLDVVGGGYGRDAFADRAAVQRTCDEINDMIERLRPHGLRLFIHNHQWEFARFEGVLAYDIVAEYCPDLLFECDTYWAANFGAEDPVDTVRRLCHRMPFLHIKDGSLVEGDAHVAVGSGVMPVAEIIAAADPAVLRALVVELDRCDSDIMDALRDSYRFLVGHGLAVGRQAVEA